MKKLIAGLILVYALFGLAILKPQPKIQATPVPVEAPQTNLFQQYPNPEAELVLNPVADYEGYVDEDMTDVMVPIPMKDRVFNRTGIQCVWCSTECLGRYAEERKLFGMTDWPDCKSYSGPQKLGNKLQQIGVRYEQTTSRSDRSLLIRAVVKERRGCLFGVPGHAMNLIHYDEAKGIVKYINNSDKTLAIRTWSMEEFNRRWDGWICVIYADNDIIPQKYNPEVPTLPIVDRNGPQGSYPKDYILAPKR